MKQLELDFKDESTTENYHSVTIDKGGNQIFKWYDTLSEDREKISSLVKEAVGFERELIKISQVTGKSVCRSSKLLLQSYSNTR